MTEKRFSQPRKRGNSLGFGFFRSVLRLGGLRAAYAWLHPVCLYYLLFDRAALKGALAYVRRAFPGAGCAGRLRHVYRLFLSQGRQLIDRYAGLSGAVDFEFHVQGKPPQQEDRGLVLLTAHAGNWQLAMTTLGAMERTVHLVMGAEDNPAVEKALRMRQHTEHIKALTVTDEVGGMIQIMNALKRGEIVSFMGDRPYGFKAAPVTFLGEPALFPCGPFHIAAAAGCPVQILLSAREGFQRYRVDFKSVLRPETDGARRPDIGPWMQEFADVLGAFIARHPYQCFLFTDVWAQCRAAQGDPSKRAKAGI